MLDPDKAEEGFYDVVLSLLEREVSGESDIVDGDEEIDETSLMMIDLLREFFFPISGSEKKNILLGLLDYLDLLISEASQSEYYVTPKELALAMKEYLSEVKPQSVYDPSAGSGGLFAECAQIPSIKYAQANTRIGRLEKLMRLRMQLLNDNVEVHIKNNSTTTAEDEMRTFDIIVCNPPYGGKLVEPGKLAISEEWLPIVKKLNRIDAAFLGHVLTYLSDRGQAAIFLPALYLFGSRMQELIHHILSENLLDGVVLLPAGTFNGTGVAPALFLFNKRRDQENRLFLIDASREYYKQGPQVLLKSENLARWTEKIRTQDYTPEADVMVVTIEEVMNNGYVLQPTVYQSKKGVERVPSERLLKECDQLMARIEDSRHRIDALMSKK